MKFPWLPNRVDYTYAECVEVHLFNERNEIMYDYVYCTARGALTKSSWTEEHLSG